MGTLPLGRVLLEEKVGEGFSGFLGEDE